MRRASSREKFLRCRNGGGKKKGPVGPASGRRRWTTLNKKSGRKKKGSDSFFLMSMWMCVCVCKLIRLLYIVPSIRPPHPFCVLACRPDCCRLGPASFFQSRRMMTCTRFFSYSTFLRPTGALLTAYYAERQKGDMNEKEKEKKEKPKRNKETNPRGHSSFPEGWAMG